MRINIYERENDLSVDSEISIIDKKLLPLKKNGWKFNWKQLHKTEGSLFYMLSCIHTPEIVEGIIMLTLFNNEMLFMNNIELAPQNIGTNKMYENVAGCLLAYACRKSFEIGRGNYNGYLSFDSKTNLIELYQNKYGANLAMGNKMYFSPETGKNLMKKYLLISK